MRLNLRKCREKSVVIPVLILLCFLISGVVIKRRMKSFNNTPENKVTGRSYPGLVLPTLVMACNEKSLKRTMETVIRFRPSATIFPIIIAPYCSNNATIEVIKSFTDWDTTITFLPKPKQTNVRHYKIALNHVFKTLKYKAVIVLEDNLDISPDFFEYFLGTHHLLRKDPSIWCISAWNDNCKEGLVQESEIHLLHRTDFFPGKGWMLLSKTWNEIEPRIPEDFVEYALHDPSIIRGRVCIRPELSRTYNFGKFGSSIDVPLRLLNTRFVPFTRFDLSYLLKEDEHYFIYFAHTRPETTVENVISGNLNKSLKYVQIPYRNPLIFRKAAKILGLMEDVIHGVPPTGLHGIVQCYIKGRRVFFTPSWNISKLFASDFKRYKIILNNTSSKYVKYLNGIKNRIK